MAANVDAVTARCGPPWVGAEWLTSASISHGHAPVALVCDLDDPHCAPFLALWPTASDLRDEQRPGATLRRNFRARRSLLRHLAARWLGLPPERIDIGYDGPGAPRVLNLSRPCFVSTASRGTLVALAIAATPVGIDIEPFEVSAAPEASVLHPAERDFLAGLPEAARARAFLQIWTAKEAFLKALGTGLTRDPARLHVVPGGPALEIHDPLSPGLAPQVHGCATSTFLATCVVL